MAGGLELDRFYAHKFCGPSRAALQSGRFPIHVTVLDNGLSSVNPADPVGGFQGIPRNMTGIATKLTGAGYSTHFAGKWHAGLATPDHTPAGRGYNTSLGYLGAANDYWTSEGLGTKCDGGAQPVTDLWQSTGGRAGDGPAFGRNNSWACSQDNQAAGCVYEDAFLTQFVVDTINAHDPSRPFFFVWAPHSVHEPYEVPEAYLAKFSNITLELRQYYSAMVNFLDDQVGTVVAALKAAGLWDTMLFVASSDNGGPLANGDSSFPADRNGAGASNFPLRGGKIGNMEGGIRVNSFVTGGALPPAQRGSKTEAFISIADWYSTFCGLAGVDPTDDHAKAAGLPAIDSVDQWPVISGATNASQRDELWIGSTDDSDRAGNTLVQGLITTANGHKFLIGSIDPAFFQGPVFPNNSASAQTRQPHLDCGDPDGSGKAYGPGCLFDILADPFETTDLAASKPDIVKTMRARIKVLQDGVYNPDRGSNDPSFCKKVFGPEYRGFIGPFLP